MGAGNPLANGSRVMYRCPYCGEPGISAWQKAIIAPGWRDAICKWCRRKVGVGRVPFYVADSPVLLPLAAFLGIVYGRPDLIRGDAGFWPVWAGWACITVATMALVTGLRLWIVPLVRK